MLEGKVENYGELFSALEKTSPAPVKFVDNVIGGNGYFNHDKKQIIINGGMSEQQNLKTLIHEIAHARLHDTNANAVAHDEKTKEIQAESIAYTVCQHYGIDTSQYSFNYIAVWSGDKQLNDLKASLGVIRKEANAIITEANEQIKVLQIPEKEKMIQEIMTEIKRNDPEFPKRGLEDIENNMRKKSLTDLREIDYAFYFPSKVDSATQSIEQKSVGSGQKPQTDTKSQAEKATEIATDKAPTKTSGKDDAKNTAKTITKSTAKTTVQKKPGIRSELATAKKQAAMQKPAHTKAPSITAELG
jgi:hypothetical protein